MSYTQSIKTDSDLYSSLVSSEIDYNTYLSLKDWLENRTGICSSLDCIKLVPGITNENLDTLERLCSDNTLSRANTPSDILDKISAFVSENTETAILNGEYRFVYDLTDTTSIPDKNHSFNFRFNQGNIIAKTQGKTDAFGNGYFLRNSLELQNTGPIKKFILGSFKQTMGLGLTFGGSPRTSSTMQTESFTESITSPMANDPFGTFLQLRMGRLSPFAAFSSKRPGEMNEKRNSIKAAGLEYSSHGLKTGVIAVSSQTFFNDSAPQTISQCAGMYGSLYHKDATFNSEISISEQGYAFEIHGLKKALQLEFSINARKYSKNYVNPLSSGTSVYYNRAFKIIQDDDTLNIIGIRQGEWGGDLSAVFKKESFSIRPMLSFAQSEILSANKTTFSIAESYCLKNLNTTLITEQAYALRHEPNDTSQILTLTALSETGFKKNLLLRFRGGLKSDPLIPYNAFGKAELTVYPFDHLALSAGYFTTATFGQTRTTRNGIQWEEKFLMNRAGSLGIYGTLEQINGGLFEPRMLGISCNFII